MYADHAIGVVLSGGDSDGSLGMCEIKRAGGLTFAQHPDSARFPFMPRHAIETGCVDFVLRPNEIAGEIGRRGRGLPRAAPVLEPGSTSPAGIGLKLEDRRLVHIFERLRSAHGVDFTHYKRTTITRRLERRMTLRRIESVEEYQALLDSDPEEMGALYQDFLIRVTEFFRDPDSFEALGRYVFPAVCKSVQERGDRIWVPGARLARATRWLSPFSNISAIAYAFRFGSSALTCNAALQKARAGVYRECAAGCLG
jgi:two-component system CheB/CheR fusion protein